MGVESGWAELGGGKKRVIRGEKGCEVDVREWCGGWRMDGRGTVGVEEDGGGGGEAGSACRFDLI